MLRPQVAKPRVGEKGIAWCPCITGCSYSVCCAASPGGQAQGGGEGNSLVSLHYWLFILGVLCCVPRWPSPGWGRTIQPRWEPTWPSTSACALRSSMSGKVGTAVFNSALECILQTTAFFSLASGLYTEQPSFDWLLAYTLEHPFFHGSLAYTLEQPFFHGSLAYTLEQPFFHGSMAYVIHQKAFFSWSRAYSIE